METRASTAVPWNRCPVRRISTLLAVIGVIGLPLGLFRAWRGLQRVDSPRRLWCPTGFPRSKHDWRHGGSRRESAN